MELDYYWEFLILSETGSYAEAAPRLFLSEPTLSRHIKAMEEAYKAPLFDRGARGLELTEYGRALLPYARNLVDTANQSRSSLRAIRARHDSALRLTSAYPVRGLLEAFSRDNPDIACRLVENTAPAGAVIENLIAGNLDLAILRGVGPDDRVARIPFTRDSYAVILGKNHPLARRKRIDIRELRDERFVSFAFDEDCHNVLLRLCREAGFEPQIAAISKNGLDAASITRYGGAAILMRNTMLAHLERGDFVTDGEADIAVVDLDPRLDVDISLVYPLDRPLTAEGKRFVDYVQDVWLPDHPAGSPAL